MTMLVDVKIVFSGHVEVTADTFDDAKAVAEKNFHALLGKCGDNQEPRIIDWEIDMHGTTHITLG